MTDETEGNESGSLADESGTGQELETGSPTVDTTDDIVNAAMKAEESAASEDESGTTKEPALEKDEKPLPYDQDPKWLAARAAEKNLQEILSDSEIEDVDELKAMLKTGMTLKEILGDRDAQQVIKDADTLKKYEEYWAEQERLKEEEELDPDELAEKYKKELDDFKSKDAAKRADKERIEAGKTAIENYNTRVESVIEKSSLGEDEAEIARMFVGVDNPFNEVDIFDKKAVSSVASQGVEKFKKFLASVKQTAIDDYVAGKSKIVPISPTETSEKSTVTKKTLPADASVEQVFGQARDELLDLILGGKSP